MAAVDSLLRRLNALEDRVAQLEKRSFRSSRVSDTAAIEDSQVSYETGDCRFDETQTEMLKTHASYLKEANLVEFMSSSPPSTPSIHPGTCEWSLALCVAGTEGQRGPGVPSYIRQFIVPLALTNRMPFIAAQISAPDNSTSYVQLPVMLHIPRRCAITVYGPPYAPFFAVAQLAFRLGANPEADTVVVTPSSGHVADASGSATDNMAGATYGRHDAAFRSYESMCILRQLIRDFALPQFQAYTSPGTDATTLATYLNQRGADWSRRHRGQDSLPLQDNLDDLLNGDTQTDTSDVIRACYLLGRVVSGSPTMSASKVSLVRGMALGLLAGYICEHARLAYLASCMQFMYRILHYTHCELPDDIKSKFNAIMGSK